MGEKERHGRAAVVARKWREIFKMLIIIVFINTVISFIVTIIVIKIVLFTLTRPIKIPKQPPQDP